MAEIVKTAEETKEVVSKHFIEQEIDKDLKEGVYDRVCTRFPPAHPARRIPSSSESIFIIW